MTSQRSFLEVNRLIQTIEVKNGIEKLGALAKTLLYLIADADLESRRLRVSDLTTNSSLGSAPTIFSRLAELKENGWIGVKDDPEDGRVRLVMLTPSTRRVFARMSKQLHRVLPGITEKFSDAGTDARYARVKSGQS